MIGQKRLDTNSQFDERHELQQDKKITSIDNRVTALEQQGGIVVDDDFSTTSTNPVENKVITVKMETIESDVNSIDGRLTNVESDVATKSEMYTIEINADNEMVHDGALLTFSDVREKCLNNSYFVYLTYENNLYIPGRVTATEVFFDSVQTVLSEITVKRVVINESENVVFTSYDIAKKNDIPPASSGVIMNANYGDNKIYYNNVAITFDEFIQIPEFRFVKLVYLSNILDINSVTNDYIQFSCNFKKVSGSTTTVVIQVLEFKRSTNTFAVYERS